MSKAAVLALLSTYIPYRPEFAALVDSDGRAIGEDAGLFLSDIFHWSDKGDDPDGWIYKSMVEMEAETGLTRRKQDAARDKLASIGVLQQARRGERGILHYRLDMDVLAHLLCPGRIAPNVQTESANQFVQKRQTAHQFVQNEQTEPADCTETPNRIAPNVQTESANQFVQKRQTVINTEKQRHKNGQRPPYIPPPAPPHPVWAIPETLTGDDFEAVWIAWYLHRHEIDRPITQTAGDQQLKKLAEWGKVRAINALEHSIANGWKNIYEPKVEVSPTGDTAGEKPKSTAQKWREQQGLTP